MELLLLLSWWRVAVQKLPVDVFLEDVASGPRLIRLAVRGHEAAVIYAEKISNEFPMILLLLTSIGQQKLF